MSVLLNAVCYLCAAVIPYLLCGVNSAIIVTKIKSGQDIRTLGSGNAGLTNTLRTQGKAAAAFVFIGDILKGVLSILAVHFLFRYVLGIDTYSVTEGMSWVNYMSGVFGVLGHVFPVWYGFKGGKGILVTFAAMLAINPIPGLALFLLFLIVVAITKYVSLGSIIAAGCYPFAVLITTLIQTDRSAVPDFLLSAVIGAMLIFMHRENIKRLRSHTEKKLGQKAEDPSAT